MRFIQCHELVNFLLPVDKSLDGLHIYLALVRAALLGVGWRGGFSSHIFYTLLLARLEYYHCVCFILQVVLQHLVILEKIEDSAPFLSVSLFELLCPEFFRRRLRKLLENFLSLEISERDAEVFLPSNILGSLRSCRQVVDIHPLI